MDKPFFSVIIPTLNEEKYIGRLLTDLVKQKSKDFEVIVVDGKSRDRTKEIVQSYQNQIALVLIESERGVSKQRNRGADQSQGKFLVFLDADIQIGSNYLSTLKQKIDYFGGEVFTSSIKPDSRLPADKLITKYMNWGIAISILLEKPLLGGFNFIVSRHAFFKTKGFDERIIHSEDTDLSMRLQKAGYPAHLLKNPMVTFSLRRYRAEGRLSVLRKMAQAGLHLITKGPITRDIFSYPMGGSWYKEYKKQKLNTKLRQRANQYLKQFKKVLLDEVI